LGDHRVVRSAIGTEYVDPAKSPKLNHARDG
jgi:hypothetical protein